MTSCNGQYSSRLSRQLLTIHLVKIKIFKQYQTHDMYYGNTTITKGTVRIYIQSELQLYLPYTSK